MQMRRKFAVLKRDLYTEKVDCTIRNLRIFPYCAFLRDQKLTNQIFLNFVSINFSNINQFFDDLHLQSKLIWSFTIGNAPENISSLFTVADSAHTIKLKETRASKNYITRAFYYAGPLKSSSWDICGESDVLQFKIKVKS